MAVYTIVDGLYLHKDLVAGGISSRRLGMSRWPQRACISPSGCICSHPLTGTEFHVQLYGPCVLYFYFIQPNKKSPMP